MSAHSSVPHLSAGALELRNQVEERLVGFEFIDFAGVSLLPTEVGLVAKITLGTSRLKLAQAQLANIVSYLEKVEGMPVAEVILTRGRIEG